MKKAVAAIGILGVLGLLIFWWLSAPVIRSAGSQLAELSAAPDLDNGQTVFWAGGCASCHAAKDAKGDDKLLLGGGHRLETPFGTFVTPNISPDPVTGIGNWGIAEFAIATRQGVSPDGKHYFPSFPYGSYAQMTDKDIADLFAFLKSLPPVMRENEPHELPLQFSFRRPLGLWKRLSLSDGWVIATDASDPQLARGQYLVESLGHCGECHTPRNLLGGMKTGDWLAGGPAPEGDGKIPNITPDENGIASWSLADIAYYLESGFTPDFDSVGGSMASVQDNMTRLSKADREAIAAYLKSIPARASGK